MGSVDEIDTFGESAAAFKKVCSPSRDLPEIRKALKRYDPALGLQWVPGEGTFYVTVMVRRGCGTVTGDGWEYPLFKVGPNPGEDEVMDKVRSRDHRAKERGAEHRKAYDAMEKRQEEMCKRALPNFGEYTSRLLACDNPWTARMLAEEMRRERTRAAA